MYYLFTILLLVVQGQTPASRPKPKKVAPPARIAHPKTLEDLVAMFRKAQLTKNKKAQVGLGYSVIPTKAETAKMIGKGPGAKAYAKARKLEGINPRLENGAAICGSVGAGLFDPKDPKRTKVNVWAATTEQLIAYEKGTAAFNEFPGGMRRFAKLVAAPGRTWYVVEQVEPGKDAGMKFTCFTKVGDRFLFVPKPWRQIHLPDPRKKKEGVKKERK